MSKQRAKSCYMSKQKAYMSKQRAKSCYMSKQRFSPFILNDSITQVKADYKSPYRGTEGGT
jgi:hypothetical protein